MPEHQKELPRQEREWKHIEAEHEQARKDAERICREREGQQKIEEKVKGMRKRLEAESCAHATEEAWWRKEREEADARAKEDIQKQKWAPKRKTTPLAKLISR